MLRSYPDSDDPDARCEPCAFDHGLASAPATLLFDDGSTRLPPTVEAAAADERRRRASGGEGVDGTGLALESPALPALPAGLSRLTSEADERLVIRAAETAIPGAVDGDGDGSGTVDLVDLLVVLAAWD